MLTMRPLLARKGARNACVTLKTPVRLTAMMSSQSLITASAAPSMPLRRTMPALLTEDRDLPDLVGDLFCHRDAVFAVRDVERVTFGTTAGVADLLRGLSRRLLVPVEQHDPRPPPVHSRSRWRARYRSRRR
jgi:hypothetical protein